MLMKNINTIKVNFKGGIIPPNDLYNILVAAGKFGLHDVRFGLREQLLLDAELQGLDDLTKELDLLGINYEVNTTEFPNIASSYSAERIFISNTWLTENIYKEIFDSITHLHRLKINISDANQSFMPLLTGNINWVAAPAEPGFWHLFIRFPKTNIVYEWNRIIHTKDIAAMSLAVEEIILQHKEEFYDNKEASGEELFKKVKTDGFNTRPAERPLELPSFRIPYYEGLNRYDGKYWLGIYRRDELFSISFLKALCKLCIDTGITQLCSTPWKTIIIKDIEEKNWMDWNALLNKYQINVRHAANELNFQVEDNSVAALKLKHLIVKFLNDIDTRSSGVCIGIKTRRKSEVFCSILVKRKALIRIGGWGLFYTYDILCAKDYNPNERTDFVFSSGNPKFVVPEQLRRAILSFYYHYEKKDIPENEIMDDAEIITE